MKHVPRSAFLFLAAVLGGCGGGGDSGSPAPPAAVNTAPTANFAFACADLACDLDSTSTDQDQGDSIAAHSWNFGDATSVATTVSPSHSFTAAGAYDVTLTVADRAGTMASVVRRITVTAPPVPAAPRANFTAACISLDCTFTDTSTYDAGSAFQSRTWDFGDASALDTASPATHRYATTALTTYTVRLTVTDGAGKSSSNVQSIVVAPPASTLTCVGGNCTLTLTQASRVAATIVSRDCSAQNNQVVITAPITETLFADGCSTAPGTTVPVNGGSVFAANTQLQVDVRSGSFASSTLVFAPALRVTGDYASGWTLTFDDGYGGPGEPDFNDLVILIKATP